MPLTGLTFLNPSAVPYYLQCNILAWEEKVDKALEVCSIALKKAPNVVTARNLLLLAIQKKDLRLLEDLENFLQKKNIKETTLNAELKAAIAYFRGNFKVFKEYALECFRSGYADNFLLNQVLNTLNPIEDKELTAWLLFYIRNKTNNPEKVKQMLKTFVLANGDKAEWLLKQFIKISPHPDYYIWLAKLLFDKNKPKEAQRILEKGYQKFPTNNEIESLLAAAYFINGNPQKVLTLQPIPEIAEVLALLDIKDLLSVNPYIANPEGRKQWVNFLSEVYKNKPQLLEVLLIKAAQEGWQRGVLFLGEVLKKVLRKPKKEDIPFFSIYLFNAMLYKGPLKGQDATYLKQLLESYPKNPNLLLVKAYDLLLKGKRSLAAKYLLEIDKEKILKTFYAPFYASKYLLNSLNERVFKNFSPVLAALTTIYIDKVSPEGAIKFADTYLKYNSSPQVFGVIGESFFRSGDLKGATILFKKAVSRYPKDANFLNTYAYLLLLTGGKKKALQAIKLLKEALKLKPATAPYMDSLGLAYYLLGNYPKAMHYITQALQKQPDDPVINYHMAELLYKVEKPCEALKYLNKAFKGLYRLPFEPEPGLELKLKRLQKVIKEKCPPKR